LWMMLLETVWGGYWRLPPPPWPPSTGDAGVVVVVVQLLAWPLHSVARRIVALGHPCCLLSVCLLGVCCFDAISRLLLLLTWLVVAGGGCGDVVMDPSTSTDTPTQSVLGKYSPDILSIR